MLVEGKDIGEEGVDCLTLVGPEVVALIRQMYVAHLLLRVIETVDALDERILHLWGGRCPVAAVAHQQQRFGSDDCCQLSFTGAATC